MASPGRAAIARISCGGWRMCLPSGVQSSAIIRRRRSASGSFQSPRYVSANAVARRDEISAKGCVSVMGQRSRRKARASITSRVTPATPANFNRVVVQTEQEPQTAGELIRFWRTRRGLSQLELSLDANVSTKHLSFVETGRSGPSRQLLVHLAQHLDLPITERNRLLLAGGFAPPYLELPYDGDVMRPLRDSLKRRPEAHEPNPAFDPRRALEPDRVQSSRVASLGRGRPGAP